MISLAIEKHETRMKDAISIKERLATTLRFLATRQSFEDLFLTAIAPQTVCHRNLCVKGKKNYQSNIFLNQG